MPERYLIVDEPDGEVSISNDLPTVLPAEGARPYRIVTGAGATSGAYELLGRPFEHESEVRILLRGSTGSLTLDKVAISQVSTAAGGDFYDAAPDLTDVASGVTIPPNTSAAVYVPAKSLEHATVNGKSQSLLPSRLEDGRAVFYLPSGEYLCTFELP